MHHYIPMILTALTSSGFCSVILYLIQRRDRKKDREAADKSAEAQMLRGIGHDRIVRLGQSYIERGSITAEEYENLVVYLYEPYKRLGGNGTAERIIEELKKLPLTKGGNADE